MAAALEKTQSPLQAAEVHGLFCGIICVTPDNSDTHWEKLVMGPKKNKTSQADLEQLYATSIHEISEFSFEFSLLLPSDRTDINIRTEALGLWCQGFLTGLQQANPPIGQFADTEVADALNDITEIAQVSYGDITGSDEDETSYFELVEYVRLAVLMVYHALKTSDTQNTLGLDNLLH
jgi:yecA family protein